jgi:hypothetical protein
MVYMQYKFRRKQAEVICITQLPVLQTEGNYRNLQSQTLLVARESKPEPQKFKTVIHILPHFQDI